MASFFNPLNSPNRRTVLKSGLATGAALTMPRLASPAIAQSTRGDIRVGVFGSDFGNISPVVRWEMQSGILFNNVFDSMIRISNQDLVPWLAEAWTQPDPLTWRIKLREGVNWHRGFGEMTAEDVVYTWRYHFDTKSYLVNGALFPIDTMKTDGKYVVEVKTKQPFGPFPSVTIGFGGYIISEKAHKEIGPDEHMRKPIGQGPFMVESNQGNEAVLVKNPDYWRPGLPKLDRIVVRAIPDSTVRLQSLMRGELDFITHPDPKDVAGVQKDANYQVKSTVGWNWDYQQFNLLPADAPAANKLVRQAISYAIDREAIVNEIYHGQASPTDNMMPQGFIGHREALMKYPKNGDLAKAQALMAQAGSSGFEVEVITSEKDWLRKELELVAAMVSQIGITYKIVNMDMGGYNNLWLNHKYQQSLEDVTLVAADPDAACWWFLHSKGSSASFKNSQLDTLLDAGREETDPVKRAPIYHNMVDLVLDECPMIYHCNVNYLQIHDKKISGFVQTNQEYGQHYEEVEWTA